MRCEVVGPPVKRRLCNPVGGCAVFWSAFCTSALRGHQPNVFRRQLIFVVISPEEQTGREAYVVMISSVTTTRHWTVGENDILTHHRLIATGGFGEVHEVGAASGSLT